MKTNIRKSLRDNMNNLYNGGSDYSAIIYVDGHPTISPLLSIQETPESVSYINGNYSFGISQFNKYSISNDSLIRVQCIDKDNMGVVIEDYESSDPKTMTLDLNKVEYNDDGFLNYQITSNKLLLNNFLLNLPSDSGNIRKISTFDFYGLSNNRSDISDKFYFGTEYISNNIYSPTLAPKKGFIVNKKNGYTVFYDTFYNFQNYTTETPITSLLDNYSFFYMGVDGSNAGASFAFQVVDFDKVTDLSLEVSPSTFYITTGFDRWYNIGISNNQIDITDIRSVAGDGYDTNASVRQGIINTEYISSQYTHKLAYTDWDKDMKIQHLDVTSSSFFIKWGTEKPYNESSVYAIDDGLSRFGIYDDVDIGSKNNGGELVIDTVYSSFYGERILKNISLRDISSSLNDVLVKFDIDGSNSEGYGRSVIKYFNNLRYFGSNVPSPETAAGFPVSSKALSMVNMKYYTNRKAIHGRVTSTILGSDPFNLNIHGLSYGDVNIINVNINNPSVISGPVKIIIQHDTTYTKPGRTFTLLLRNNCGQDLNFYFESTNGKLVYFSGADILGGGSESLSDGEILICSVTFMEFDEWWITGNIMTDKTTEILS